MIQIIIVAVKISLTLVNRSGLKVRCNKPDITVSLIIR